MDTPDPRHRLNSLDQLEAVYGQPHERARWKEIDFLNPDYRAFVEASPFMTIGSAGPDGLDCSPRGDVPGFVQVLDDRTLALPDRPGNNRIDTLRNIVADPRVSLLLLVPGVGESLRINGRAEITTDPALMRRFAVQDKLPRSVLVVHIEAVYFHCSRALVRSQLWNPAHQIERTRLPSPGQMHRRLSGGNFDATAYDLDLPARTQAGLY